MKLTTSQIGKSGELLVQLKLLLYGIESSPLTTDSGIDLVAYSRKKAEAITIQVKTNLKPKPSGGKGKLSLGWWLPEQSIADLYALVDLDKYRVWLFKSSEVSSIAQQNPKGRLHLIMKTDPTVKDRRDNKPVHDHEFGSYLLENCVHKLF